MLQHLKYVFRAKFFVLAIKMVPQDYIAVGDKAGLLPSAGQAA